MYPLRVDFVCKDIGLFFLLQLSLLLTTSLLIWGPSSPTYPSWELCWVFPNTLLLLLPPPLPLLPSRIDLEIQSLNVERSYSTGWMGLPTQHGTSSAARLKTLRSLTPCEQKYVLQSVVRCRQQCMRVTCTISRMQVLIFVAQFCRAIHTACKN